MMPRINVLFRNMVVLRVGARRKYYRCEFLSSLKRGVLDAAELANVLVQRSSRSKLAARATGITTIPTLKNCHAEISSFSRRRAINHRIVASDPVTDKFGPRS